MSVGPAGEVHDAMDDQHASPQQSFPEVDALLRDALARARRMLTENEDTVRRVVTELLDRETLTGRELADILSGDGTSAGVLEAADVELVG